MLRFIRISLIVCLFFFVTSLGYAQSPQGKTLGVGVMLGDPTGATLKLWDGKDVAYNIYVGNSFFGNVTIGADYMKHFNAFNSRVVNLHLAGGVVIGTGSGGNWYRSGKRGDWYYREDNGAGVGLRGMVGINFVPNNTPLELSAEFGPFLGVTPDTGFGFISDFSIRLYL